MEFRQASLQDSDISHVPVPLEEAIVPPSPVLAVVIAGPSLLLATLGAGVAAVVEVGTGTGGVVHSAAVMGGLHPPLAQVALRAQSVHILRESATLSPSMNSAGCVV